ncbi:hypothetical protein GP486_005853, partial [Trichoglossum hirsutum]
NPTLGLEVQLRSEFSTIAHGGDGSVALATPPSLAHGNSDSSKTFRVRGLSATHNKRTIKGFLKSKLGLGGDSRLKICSLAHSPHRHEEKVATINFEGTSSVLQSDGNEWVIDAPGNDSSDDDIALSREYEQNIIIDSHFEGFTPMSSFENDADHKIDIVAVSGLGGHAFGSFKERGGKHMWLRDALPIDLPNARVLIYGYHTKLANSRSFQDLEALASTFRASLGAIRSQYTDNTRWKPLIFIGHSLGGVAVLIQKADRTLKALIQMNEGNRMDKSNFASTCGILFFGVPNQGIDISSLIPMVMDQPNMLFLMSLGKESGYLRDRHRAFCKAFTSRDTKIISFYETEESPTAQKHGNYWSMTGPRAVLVDSSSATHGRPWESEAHHIQAINRNHSDIVKFSLQDKYYYVVLQHLRQLAADAIDLTQNRFPEPKELTKEQKDCLQSLSFPEFGNRLNDVFDPHDATFQWIWKNKAFCQWLEGDKAIFWVRGKPGCGKSTLMKLLFQNRSTLSMQMANTFASGPIIASHFFCGRGARLERSIDGLLRSLLIQILKEDPSLFGYVLEAYRQMRESRNNSDGIQWSISNLRRIFTSSIIEKPPTRGVCIFIDGLDECDGPLQDHLSFLRRIVTHPAVKSTIKICVSSRPVAILCAGFQGYPELSLPEETSRDIYNYVHEKTEYLSQSGEDGDDDFQLLRAEIIQRANGVFLWVSLVVEELLKGDAEGDTICELRDRLSSIPPDLDGMYRRILGGIEERYREETRLMLRLILCALHPLTLEEFRFAMAFGSGRSFDSQISTTNSRELVRGDKEMEKRIRSRCGGLVEATTIEAEVHATVKFIHESVKDFLLSEDGIRVLELDPNESPVVEGHRYLLRSCIQYLTIPEIGDFLSSLEASHVQPSRISMAVSLIRQFPFLSYATPLWLEHWKAMEKLGVCQSSQVRRLEGKVRRQGQSHLQTWSTLYNAIADPNIPFATDTTLLHIATRAGITSFVEEELRTVDDVNTPRGQECTLLRAASISGNESLVKMLLQRGANVNDHDYFGYGNAIQAAAREGFGAIVRILLENGANVNGEGNYWGSALQAATFNGHTEVIQLLLRNGANVNAKGGYWGSALQAAAGASDKAGIEILLASGADINAESGYYGSPLQAAAYGGRKAVVQHLLENGADVNATGGAYGSALQAAAAKGNVTIVQILLEHGADTNAKGGRHGSPLQAAMRGVRGEHGKVAQLLLENGADVGAEDGIYSNMLRSAAVKGDDVIVRLLLRKAKDFPLDLLQVAMEYDNKKLVLLLFEEGLDVSTTDTQGCAAIHRIAYSGWASILSTAVDMGSDHLARDIQGRSPLHHAASGTSADCVSYLLGLSEDPNVPDRNGWTPLHWACKRGNMDAVKVLLENGGEKDRRTDLGWSPVRIALFHGHDDVVMHLLSAFKISYVISQGYSEQRGQQAEAERSGDGPEPFRRGGQHIHICDGFFLNRTTADQNTHAIGQQHFRDAEARVSFRLAAVNINLSLR